MDIPTKSMSRFLTLLFGCFLLISLTHPAAAQQQQDENSLLPDIDPQDIEIRSQFRARFPGLRRQPILGFDPNPRVYQIDPNRMPFMESQEQVVANLPVSELSRPAPPAYNGPGYSDSINAFGRAGIGSYLSPDVQFWGVHRLKSGGYIGGDVDYSSSDGHLDGQQSSFRFLDINGEYAAHLGRSTRLHLNGGFQNDFNHLYNLASLGQETPRKDYTGFNLGGTIQNFSNTVEGWAADARIRYFDTELQAGSLSGDINETIYQGSFSRQWAGSRVEETFSVMAGAKGGVYGASSDQEGWTTVQAGAKYNRLFNYATHLRAKAQVYYVTDVAEDKFYLAPAVEVQHDITDDLSITGSLSGQPYLKSIEQHHENNRFLEPGNALVHTYSLDVSGKASLEYYRGSTLEGGVSYMSASNYPYYFRELSADPAPEAQFYNIGYMDASNFKIYAGITHQLVPERFWLSGRAYVQTPKLDNGDRIPFTENWGVTSTLSLRIVKPITIEGWADYVGSRRTAQDEKLEGFLLIGGQADINVTGRFGAYVKFVNLLDQQYEIWDGYTERPMQVYAGITVKLN